MIKTQLGFPFYCFQKILSVLAYIYTENGVQGLKCEINTNKPKNYRQIYLNKRTMSQGLKMREK